MYRGRIRRDEPFGVSLLAYTVDEALGDLTLQDDVAKHRTLDWVANQCRDEELVDVLGLKPSKRIAYFIGG